MKTIEYTPQNVCSRKMVLTIDNGKVVKFEVVGGCNGNLQGIGKLVEGMDVDEVIHRLEGIKCRGSRNGMTSCPDQLAQALKKSL